MKRKLINTPHTPIYRDAGFELYDAETTRNAFIKETENEREPDLYIYSRYRNPTVVAAEEEIMRYEGSKWALLTESGMSAVDTALSIFQEGSSTGNWLFFSEIYGGTISFIDHILKKRRGIEINIFNPSDEKYNMAEFETAMETYKPGLVFIETISNPMLIVTDVPEVVRIAHKYEARVILDNTFATPLLWKPLETGVDIVIYSATKYFSGHGNLTAGVLCGNDPYLMREAVEYRKFVGHMLSADDAYRLNSQIQTLELRFMQQCANAAAVCRLLLAEPAVRKVWYPGLETHPTYNEALKLFGDRGFGAMLTFDFMGSIPQEKMRRRDAFIRAVSETVKVIPTLGDPRTILMPVESVWGAKYPEPGMLRLSAGFENTDELESVIKTGLRMVT